MRRSLGLVALWIAVFVVVVVARRGSKAATAASAPLHVSEVVDAITRATRAVLDDQPTRNVGLTSEIDDVEPGIVDQLNTAVREAQATITGCVDRARRRSVLPTDYYDVSFVLEPDTKNTLAVGQGPLTPPYRVSRVIIERTTLQMQSVEERCLANAFEGLALRPKWAPPTRRLMVPMCFNNFARNVKNSLQGE